MCLNVIPYSWNCPDIWSSFLSLSITHRSPLVILLFGALHALRILSASDCNNSASSWLFRSLHTVLVEVTNSAIRISLGETAKFRPWESALFSSCESVLSEIFTTYFSLIFLASSFSDSAMFSFFFVVLSLRRSYKWRCLLLSCSLSCACWVKEVTSWYQLAGNSERNLSCKSAIFPSIPLIVKLIRRILSLVKAFSACPRIRLASELSTVDFKRKLTGVKAVCLH